MENVEIIAQTLVAYNLSVGKTISQRVIQAVTFLPMGTGKI